MLYMASKSRNQLILFFVLTFILAWGSWIPAFLMPNSPRLLSFIGLFAPAISALVVAGIYNGKEGILGVLVRYKYINFSTKWYLVAVFLLPITYILSIFINLFLFHYTNNSVFVGSPIYFIIAAFIWLMVINSGEEVGWRGFALPILLKDLKNSIWASLLLGLIWGFWHLPMYLIPGQSSFPFSLFLLLTIGLSFIYIALFIKTKGSLLPAVLLHAGTDIGPRIFRTANFTLSVWFTIDIIIIVVGIGLILSEPLKSNFSWEENYK